jgi:hypothetical protein
MSTVTAYALANEIRKSEVASEVTNVLREINDVLSGTA